MYHFAPVAFFSAVATPLVGVASRLVILSAAKDLRPAQREILRCAQDDRTSDDREKLVGDIGNAYEIAVEVSPAFRKLGVAHQLLSLALEFEALEEYLIVGLGLSWHWDYESQSEALPGL